MRKQNKGYNPLGTQKFFKNVPADIKFNPVRTYYSFIQIDGKDHIVEYEGTLRSQAEKDFYRQAKLHHGTFNGKVYSLSK